MFIRCVGTKNDKFSLCRINIKENLIIYLIEVCDIGSKQFYRDDSVHRMV